MLGDVEMNTRKHHDDEGDEDVMDLGELGDGDLDSVSGGSFFGTDPDGNSLDKNGLAISPRHSQR